MSENNQHQQPVDAVYCTACHAVLFYRAQAQKEIGSWSPVPERVSIAWQCNGCLQWQFWSLQMKQPFRAAWGYPAYWSAEGSHYGICPN